MRTFLLNYIHTLDKLYKNEKIQFFFCTLIIFRFKIKFKLLRLIVVFFWHAFMLLVWLPQESHELAVNLWIGDKEEALNCIHILYRSLHTINKTG